MANIKLPIPKFQSEDHERAFWSKHDSAEFVDWSQATRQKLPKLKPSLKTNLTAAAILNARSFEDPDE